MLSCAADRLAPDGVPCSQAGNAVAGCAGEEETDLDLGELIKKGEVAWISAEEMLKASEASSTAQNGASTQHHSPTRAPKPTHAHVTCMQSNAVWALYYRSSC